MSFAHSFQLTHGLGSLYFISGLLLFSFLSSFLFPPPGDHPLDIAAAVAQAVTATAAASLISTIPISSRFSAHTQLVHHPCRDQAPYVD